MTLTDRARGQDDAPYQDNTPIVTLTLYQLRIVLQEEIIKSAKAFVSDDRFLDVEEASAMLAVSSDWLYRNGKSFPFTRKLGRKMLRFSYQGILKYLAARKAA